VTGPAAWLTQSQKQVLALQGYITQNNQYGCLGNNAKQNTDIPLTNLGTIFMLFQYCKFFLVSPTRSTEKVQLP
jgi:hypothetical protein